MMVVVERREEEEEVVEWKRREEGEGKKEGALVRCLSCCKPSQAKPRLLIGGKGWRDKCGVL